MKTRLHLLGDFSKDAVFLSISMSPFGIPVHIYSEGPFREQREGELANIGFLYKRVRRTE